MSAFADSEIVRNGAPPYSSFNGSVSATSAATAPTRPSSVT